jgi:hypothetical protein
MKNGRVVFKQENGFPKDFTIETKEYEDFETEFKGYKSFFRDKNEKLIFEFIHSDFRSRIHWASGYITALREVNLEKHIK